MNRLISNLEPVTGRQVLAGLGWAVLIAAVLGTASWFAVVDAVGVDTATVLVVAETYLAITIGLTIAVGGPTGVRDRLALRPVPAREFARAAAALVVGIAAAALVTLAISPLTGGPTATVEAVLRAGSDVDRLPTATALTVALILVRVGLLTSLAEELLFRGALHGWLRTRLSAPATIALTAVLFTAEHAVRPVLIPVVLGYGLAAGWVRHRSGSTLPTVAMHIVTDVGLLVAAVAVVG
jgi:membrane protease YdiL (CAAX protease family)